VGRKRLQLIILRDDLEMVGVTGFEPATPTSRTYRTPSIWRRRKASDPIEIQLGYPMPSKYRHASTILIPAGGLRAGSSCTTRIREAFGAFAAAHSRDEISRSQAAG